MKYRVHLSTFLRSGQFGPLELGLSMVQVRDLIGEPEEEMEMEEQRTNWFYGCLQLNFEGQQLDGIFVVVERGFPAMFSTLCFAEDDVNWLEISPVEFGEWCHNAEIAVIEMVGVANHGFQLATGLLVAFTGPVDRRRLNGVLISTLTVSEMSRSFGRR